MAECPKIELMEFNVSVKTLLSAFNFPLVYYTPIITTKWYLACEVFFYIWLQRVIEAACTHGDLENRNIRFP